MPIRVKMLGQKLEKVMPKTSIKTFWFFIEKCAKMEKNNVAKVLPKKSDHDFENVVENSHIWKKNRNHPVGLVIIGGIFLDFSQLIMLLKNLQMKKNQPFQYQTRLVFFHQLQVLPQMKTQWVNFLLFVSFNQNLVFIKRPYFQV